MICDNIDIVCMYVEGKKRRRVAETLMNSESSRSHAIFIYYLVQQLRILDPSTGSFTNAEKSSKINLVDLAGSERMNMTGASTEKLIREAANINRSLSVLGDVIKALSERDASKGSSDFVPYRNSILTYLLKDSLGI